MAADAIHVKKRKSCRTHAHGPSSSALRCPHGMIPPSRFVASCGRHDAGEGFGFGSRIVSILWNRLDGARRGD